MKPTAAFEEVFQAELAQDSAYGELSRQERLRVLYARAGENFAAYIRVMMPAYERARHAVRLVRFLHRVETGEIDRFIISMPPRHSKALALDTPIPTPSGWTTMGEIRVGDRVFDERGVPCNVTFVSPVWEDRPVYSVITDDGDVIIADENHEWPVSLCRKRRHVVKLKTSGELAELAERTSLRRPMINRQGPLVLPDVDLPIDPYVLGLWLGDGHSGSGGFTKGTADLAFLRGQMLEAGFETSDRSQDNLTTILGLRGYLVDAGLLGNKHIPSVYLRASEKQRLALLQGLVDTDGGVAPGGQVMVGSKFKHLSDSILELVRSLGRKASQYETRATLYGKDCGPFWSVSFYHAEAARLPRKRERCREAGRQMHRFISVQPAGRADTRCISVDSSSHLFLAGRSFLPTHNSTHVTEYFPAWYQGRNPTHQMILGAATQRLADKFGSKVRDLISSPIHEAIFPECRLKRGKKAVRLFETEAGGVCLSVGRGAKPLGFGAHLMLIDDPLGDEAEADSEVIRASLHEWYEVSMYSRLMPESRVGLVATRMHEDDLTGYVLREHKADNWIELRMPVIAEENEFDEVTGELVRAEGEALWPEWYPLDREPGEQGQSLKRIREAIGPIKFQRHYQQRTGFVEGAVFHEDWLLDNVYKTEPNWKRMNRLILGDPATGKKQKKKSSMNYTAIFVLGLSADRHVYVLDMVRDVLELRERWRALKRLHQRWKPYLVFWEDYAVSADGQYFKEKMDDENYSFRFETPPNRGKANLKKEDRIRKLHPWFADGRIHFPEAMWRPTVDGDRDLVKIFLQDEFKTFPSGVTDDMLDALAHMLDERLPLEWPMEEEDEIDEGGAPRSWMAS